MLFLNIQDNYHNLKIQLLVMKYLKEDIKAKTKSFFLNGNRDFFSEKYIDFIKNFYLKFKKDVRICLHKNNKSKHHDMIILQQKKNFYKPHKHRIKGETYHIILGSMICVIFNNNGQIQKAYIIKKNNIFRTPVNKYHTMMPLSKYVIFHESRTGPFLKNDSIFPKWSKKFENKKEIDILKKRSLKVAKLN